MNMIQLIKGDITKLSVDAVVNAANSGLLGGGGVDGAIHRAGGPEIMDDCIRIRTSQGGCKTGNVVMTTAGNIDAKAIIHAVGPVWHGGRHHEEALLKSCYRSAMVMAFENSFTSIAFPNISTGIYGFPKQLAAQIAVDEVKKQLIEHEDQVMKVIFVCFDDENFEIYQQLLND